MSVTPLTEAQRKLVADNYGFVYFTAKQCSAKYSLGFDDALGICSEVACRAAAKFDPARGFTFCTYSGTAMWRACADAKFGRTKKYGSLKHAGLPWIDALDEVYGEECAPDAVAIDKDDNINAARVLRFAMAAMTREQREAVIGYYGLFGRQKVRMKDLSPGESRCAGWMRMRAGLKRARKALAAAGLLSLAGCAPIRVEVHHVVDLAPDIKNAVRVLADTLRPTTRPVATPTGRPWPYDVENP